MRLIDGDELEQYFRNVRSKLKAQDYNTAIEFHTRDNMLLNAEQFVHLLPTIQAVPIEVLQEIKQKTYKLHPIKRGETDYVNGVYDGMCRVIDIVCDTIDNHIKEITNEECD